MDTTAADSATFWLHPFRALRVTSREGRSAPGPAPTSAPTSALPALYRSMPGRPRVRADRAELRTDPTPGIYVHEYTSAGVTVRGVVALLDLRGTDRSVCPHEGLHERQVRQLAHRMERLTLNPAPIMLAHHGPAQVREILARVTAAPPALAYTDRGGQLQRVWPVTEAATVDALARELAGTRAVIADGHHRFAAARRLAESDPESGWARTLVMVIDEADTPLQLCAVHRTVAGIDLRAVRAATVPGIGRFQWHRDSNEALARLHDSVVLHDGQRWASLTPAQPPELLVSWLHEEMLPACAVTGEQLRFHHSAGDAIAHAGNGVCVLLPAPTFEQVVEAAAAGRLLPRKATSFQPKPHLGVLMRELAGA